MSPLKLCCEPRQEESGVLVGCRALGMGGERGWAPAADTGNFGSEAGGRLGVVGDGEGLLPFR